ncbi:hypothetical protein Moror_5089 [Moniliophthora roreri MCA 2997]|uniref:Uncharacterized protein n=1 Tax=Moniliophthora roreri (strain MCA 2997) TaxID=1381753 RepID=V2WLZ2_MONRO|nr:hypothetical protein Moror_5089 [Moniliophthora roreri MCA 2997]
MSSNASASSSSGSYSVRSLPEPPAGHPSYTNDITYTSPFNPSPFELLFLVNTGGHDDSLRNAAVGQPHLQYAIDGLVRLRAQHASLNAIIEETNVYAANLAFNATAARPAPLVLQGPMMVPSFSTPPEPSEPQLPTRNSRLGPLSSDLCDTDPNDPAFLRATETYRARIGAAVELARDQHAFCPHHSQTEPLLPWPTSPISVVPKLEPPSDASAIKSEPPPDSPSELLYPSDSASNSDPMYAQSIGVASASPSLAPEPQSRPPPTPPATDPFNPFDVDGEPLAPSTVPFLASGQFNPAFVSIRDVARANSGVPIDSRTYTNAWGNWTPTRYSPADWSLTRYGPSSFSMGRRDRLRDTGTDQVEGDCGRCLSISLCPVSADFLRLGIFLGIVVSDEGRIDFLDRAIPGAHSLLTTISTGVTGTMTSTETENNEEPAGGEVTDPDDLVPVFVGIPDHEAQDVTLPDGRIVQVVRMGSAT